ncbi:MAG: DNA polymerase III subunit delta' [Parvibaculum sp.]
MSELPEPDRLGEFRHPRETQTLYGHEEAERLFFDAFMANRLHHAWLITGPKGIGKATLSYRIAKFLLTFPDAEAAAALGMDGLAIDNSMPAVRQVIAQGHPNLLALRRPVDEKTKKAKTVIPVDEVRKTTSFFGKSAGAGGWRICLVDSADEMNANSANALLKVLEEPPARSLFLLVSHQPGRLLPTIRSRCRVLPLTALDDAAMEHVLADNGITLPPADLAAVETLAEGSAGRALLLAGGEGLNLYREMVKLLCQMPRMDVVALHTLADKGAKRGEGDQFAVLVELLRDWIARAVRVGAGSAPSPDIVPGEGQAMMRLTGGGSLDRWVEVWEKIGELAGRADALNMDRKLVILNMFSILEAAALSIIQPA